MKPRGLLMIEHRLIERMVMLINAEIKQIKKTDDPNIPLINDFIDFIRTYADKTHHGKEEDILFRDCAMKSMSEEDTKLMNELLEEHQYGRKMIRELNEAKEKYIRGDHSQLEVIIHRLEALADLYPNHIIKEDDAFFPHTEKYFSKAELDRMLNEFREFDQKMIHEKYRLLIESLERII